ncbi:MAG: efflux RND transporter periplasmic adaptor subunit [Magnetococcales bacterium]|nr:efflux RND transporter periplasmic adaptor subunit [Magnetococcales bacterium]
MNVCGVASGASPRTPPGALPLDPTRGMIPLDPQNLVRWLVYILAVLWWGLLPAAWAADHAAAVTTVPELSTIWRVELFPKRRTQLSSDMAARITKIAPREGRHFEKGEVLVTFDCAMEAAQMQRARATLDAAEAKSQVSDRLSRLQATSKLEERVAQAEAAQARAELAIIQVKINHCQIQAPFSGRVIALSAQEHQYVKAGDPLMDILDEQNLEVVFLLPSRQLPQLTVGDRFQVFIEETQRAYPAQIVAFGALIDSVSQSVKVFGTIEGSFPELRPGMSGTAQLATHGAVPAPPPAHVAP